jgi:hypothetical protein
MLMVGFIREGVASVALPGGFTFAIQFDQTSTNESKTFDKYNTLIPYPTQ